MVHSYSHLAGLRVANEKLWERTAPQGDLSTNDYGEGSYYEGDLPALFTDFYRLEYIYSSLKTKPFNGVPKRHENILKKVTQVFEGVVEELRNLFLHVFEDWLSQHAITDPKKWAQERSRSEESSIGDVWRGMLHEYIKYLRGPNNMPLPQQYGTYTRLFLLDFIQIPEAQDSLWDLLGGREAYFQQELENAVIEFETNPEDIRDRYNLNLDTDETNLEQRLQDYFQKTSISDFMEGYDFQELLQNADPDVAEYLIQLGFEKKVFPLWYKYWSAKGIDKTRKTVETVYKMLQQEGSLGERYAAVSLATNTSHQTGSMLEYVEEVSGSSNLKETLQELTQGKLIPEIDPVLKESGVQI